MVEVASWLAELGLGHHGETFRANGIGVDVLHDLTDADLKELGLNLGDRKRLLKAIAALKDLSALVPTRPAHQQAQSREAERRQLTVMFVDMVGSTALSGRLDPEDLRDLIGAYHDCVAATVAGFDGFVAKFMGDGVLVYFGYPQAHEDDAERAVRAALEVVTAVAGLVPKSGAPAGAHRYRNRTGRGRRSYR